MTPPEGVRGAPPPLLTIEEAAERLNVSVRNIREQIYRRRLRIVKIGRLVRIEESELEAFIEKGRSRWT